MDEAMLETTIKDWLIETAGLYDVELLPESLFDYLAERGYSIIDNIK